MLIDAESSTCKWGYSKQAIFNFIQLQIINVYNEIQIVKVFQSDLYGCDKHEIAVCVCVHACIKEPRSCEQFYEKIRLLMANQANHSNDDY